MRPVTLLRVAVQWACLEYEEALPQRLQYEGTCSARKSVASAERRDQYLIALVVRTARSRCCGPFAKIAGIRLPMAMSSSE